MWISLGIGMLQWEWCVFFSASEMVPQYKFCFQDIKGVAFQSGEFLRLLEQRIFFLKIHSICIFHQPAMKNKCLHIVIISRYFISCVPINFHTLKSRSMKVQKWGTLTIASEIKYNSYSFDLHFSNNQWCWKSFHVPLGHLYVFFGEMSI